MRRPTIPRPDAAEIVRLLPAAGLMATWIALMPAAGGFQPRDWLPAGLVMLGLLAAAVVGGARALPPARAARWALGALAAFTAWSFLSIAWSEAPGTAWEESNLLLTSLLACWILALVPWRARTADLLLLAFSAGAADITARFLDFRWTQPLDYPNTAAAFAFMAAAPALVMAARPDLPPLVKGVAQALATFLAAYALLPQSRGSILGGLAMGLVLLVAAPFRWRLALHAGALAITVVLASGPILDVFTSASVSGRVRPALHAAAETLAIATAAGLATGLLLALAEARVRLGERGRALARRGGFGVSAALAVALAAVAVSHADGIRDGLGDQWNSLTNPGTKFTGPTEDSRAGLSRLAGADPLERYDYWRVSLDGFLDAPVGGLGAGGFEHRYVIERRYPKLSKYPHNLAMRVLGDTGLVGVLLVLGGGGAVLWGLWRRRSEVPVAERGVAAAALGVAAYFAAHGSFDWLEAYPVLAGPALGFLFVALAARDRAHRLADVVDGEGRPSAPPPKGAPATRAVVLGRGTLALVAVAALGSLLAPWLALRYRERAVETWPSRPLAAYQDLGRAADLDRLDPSPLVFAGVIGISRGDLELARDAFRRAADREDYWLPHLGLALVAAGQGDRATARAEIDRTVALNRLDPSLPAAVKAIRGGGEVDPGKLLRQVLVSPLFTTEELS